uniref:Nucleotide-diphospho-sugar transferase domain-containing protein n=2 Tax=Auxenochlorella protothecoides TaxID=3075 RepID=A0A1D2ABV6_AUXPR
MTTIRDRCPAGRLGPFQHPVRALALGMCSLFLLCVLVPIKFNSRDGYALDLPPLFRTSSSTVTEHHNGRHTLERPSREKTLQYPGLAAALKKVAINNEVLVVMSDRRYAHNDTILDLCIQSINRVGVKNALVLALDNKTRDFAEGRGMAAFMMKLQAPESQQPGGARTMIGALKFRIMAACLDLGYSVLFSDADVLVLQNPFSFLVRDSDVECMTDGYDVRTAYGFQTSLRHDEMGYGSDAVLLNLVVLNAGFIYVRATEASRDLMSLVVRRVETENTWDQTILSESVFLPSTPTYKSPAVTSRIMDYELFLNSLTLFRELRHTGQHYTDFLPAVVHVNAHTDKAERMEAIVDRYVKGNFTALDHFPLGSAR